jgi:hypothetical protein
VTGPNGLSKLWATREATGSNRGWSRSGTRLQLAGGTESGAVVDGSEVPQKQAHEGVGPRRTGNRTRTDTVDSTSDASKAHRGGMPAELFGVKLALLRQEPVRQGHGGTAAPETEQLLGETGETL